MTEPSLPEVLGRGNATAHASDRAASPKTERHAGHDRRSVPITPKLMKLVLTAMLEPDLGGNAVLQVGINGHGRIIEVAFKSAKVEKWDDLLQTLRRSCEIEWAMNFPQLAVARWAVHSLAVSMRHYSNSIPDELFDRASGRNQDDENLVLNPVLTTAKSQETESNTPETASESKVDETQ